MQSLFYMYTSFLFSGVGDNDEVNVPVKYPKFVVIDPVSAEGTPVPLQLSKSSEVNIV